MDHFYEWHAKYLKVMIAKAMIGGALLADASDERLREVLPDYWRMLTGNYENMMRIASSVPREFEWLRRKVAPNINAWSDAIARFLHGDGDKTDLMALASQSLDISNSPYWPAAITTRNDQ